MRIATSYFYQIRFFKPYMIPVSTAVWDPKWYHEFKDQQHCYIDKNGVMCGLRIAPLQPGSTCSHLCRGPENCATKDPDTCPFLQEYLKQLRGIDFQDFMLKLERNINIVSRKLQLNQEPLVVFIVHEAIGNPCSERGALLQWFNENNCNVRELDYPVVDNY